jgi:putative ABC transport system ATP-binding protein
MQHEVIIKVDNVVKQFDVGDSELVALQGVSTEIHASDFAIIYGPSGCGKSTLLNTITGLEVPTQGEVSVRGEKIYHMKETERSHFRAAKFGIVFQQPLWIKSFSLLYNVALPLLLNGVSEHKAVEEAKEQLNNVGLIKYVRHKPMELSGGQQQKAGLARALVHNPWIIIADEPTGNLDTHSADEVVRLFQDLNVKHRRTIVMVTHNLAYLPMATRKIAMKDGQITDSEREVDKMIKDEYRQALGGANL